MKLSMKLSSCLKEVPNGAVSQWVGNPRAEIEEGGQATNEESDTEVLIGPMRHSSERRDLHDVTYHVCDYGSYEVSCA